MIRRKLELNTSKHQNQTTAVMGGRANPFRANSPSRLAWSSHSRASPVRTLEPASCPAPSPMPLRASHPTIWWIVSPWHKHSYWQFGLVSPCLCEHSEPCTKSIRGCISFLVFKMPTSLGATSCSVQEIFPGPQQRREQELTNHRHQKQLKTNNGRAREVSSWAA